ncbi:hypothetical protein PILCRDRAFT_820354 [Piloderma croceum F 1598]|uniref:Uncharacterized protein n=1 Tax=Piloderma croceum (strain F 1598) TaxID=765440 RepID=A0A0C3FUA2_PILCF|nr:hypothetical protein PILCRDRAFT_820354 [Piloderma croceum F 1598]
MICRSPVAPLIDPDHCSLIHTHGLRHRNKSDVQIELFNFTVKRSMSVVPDHEA